MTPAGKSLGAVRRIRDDIERRVHNIFKRCKNARRLCHDLSFTTTIVKRQAPARRTSSQGLPGAGHER